MTLLIHIFLKLQLFWTAWTYVCKSSSRVQGWWHLQCYT